MYDYLCARLRIRNEDVRLWSMEDEVSNTLSEDTNISMFFLAEQLWVTFSIVRLHLHVSILDLNLLFSSWHVRVTSPILFMD